MKRPLRSPLVISVLIAAVYLLSMRYANASGRRFSETEEVFARPNGLALRATVFEPNDANTGARPAVVLIHGGAWLAGGRYLKRWYGRRLAERGYVVVSVTYRRMPNHEFPACLHDVKAAVRWVRLNAERLRVDPDRIAALGDSAGGHLSVLLAVTQGDGAGDERTDLEGEENPGASSAVQAVVALYPPCDLAYYMNPHPVLRLGGFTPAYMRRFVRGLSANAEDALRSASPIERVHSGVCPVLLIHGTDDPIVPYDQSVRMHQRLRAFGVRARLISVPGKGHGFDYIYHDLRGRLFEQIQGFLEECLAPTTASQDDGPHGNEATGIGDPRMQTQGDAP